METKTTVTKGKKKYWWKASASFLMVLFTMPLADAVMILMEHFLDETTLHYAAFAMGAVGMLMVIAGVFAKGDTRQTLWGLFGGLLFWTGLGGIPLHVLCQPLRHTARTRPRDGRSCNPPRIPDTASLIRVLDDGHGAVPV